ncbi:hypothetical protein [Paenibacillus donghaensis]|uniref:Uncharacterized protein n=1 Tax=Paenibacillus donghaensis TaxID=414771 RepID=A0A2Z2KTA4_9BACL|nr:hypothetical protein [Paenibacillus donghaensis]ASA22598.1 hypothetical protein B9T62_18500 [Paenibacillus donghaensis]
MSEIDIWSSESLLQKRIRKYKLIYFFSRSKKIKEKITDAISQIERMKNAEFTIRVKYRY